MAAWTTLPIETRLFLLAILGLALGGLVNWAIYALAWFPLPVSPWGAPTLNAPRQPWYARIPVIGWWVRGHERDLQNEAAVNRLRKMGYDVPQDWKPWIPFWFRPLLLELLIAGSLPGLYWLETQTGLLLPPHHQVPGSILAFSPWMHCLFLSHAILFILMTVATFIDFDEQTIPDMITIPGTVVAVILATSSVHFLLPCDWNAQMVPCLMSLPAPWNAFWNGGAGLGLALAIWTGWCFALSNRRWINRKGFAKAIQFFFARMVRHGAWRFLMGLWVLGMVLITVVWNRAPLENWQGMLSALVGMAVGGGTVWAVRLVASAAMQEEAMGFGDVTLMGMIGAFIGWQASLLAFFLAPLGAIAIFIIQGVLTGQRAQAFGPYLCIGAAATIFYWPTLWTRVLQPNLNNIMIVGLLVCLVLMGAILTLWRSIKVRLFPS